ncbi:MAG: preprotein translocase subunit SecG [Candidatus Aminicenantes bacterium]|nr:preprotein translocase subunit SecG [Candidatus Aminicenantes bacterium]
MTTLIIIIHIIVCFILIFAVLLQSGKSADLAGAFGGVGSQTAFGARGSASLMSKITTISAILFMFTSMGLWILSARGTKSVLSGERAPKAAATAPAPKKEEPKAPATQTPAQTQEKVPASEPVKK